MRVMVARMVEMSEVLMRFWFLCLRKGCVLSGFMMSVLQFGQVLVVAPLRLVRQVVQCGSSEMSLPLLAI